MSQPFNNRVQITVPSTQNVDIPARELQESMVDNVLTKLAGLFGGATSVPGMGAWISKEKGLIKEPIVNVYAFATENEFKSKKNQVFEIAIWLCDVMKQEMVAVEMNGELHFVNKMLYAKAA